MNATVTPTRQLSSSPQDVVVRAAHQAILSTAMPDQWRIARSLMALFGDRGARLIDWKSWLTFNYTAIIKETP